MKHTVELVELQNGAKGLLIDAPDSTVTNIDVNFRAGDYLAPKGKTDTAHIMEHLAFGANSRFSSMADFSKEYSKNGAYNNAYTGDYHMGYVAECAEFETVRVIDLLCAAIESPKFIEQEFEAEVANVREELKSRKNNHGTELALALEHELGLVPKTYTERSKELSNITVQDIQEHHVRTHYASNMRFVVTGPLKKHRASIIKRLESIAIPKGDGRIELPTEAFTGLDTPLVKHNDTVENVYYRFETLAERVFDKDEREAFGACNTLLYATFHSRIFGKARERGLLYGIGASYYNTKTNSIGYIAGQVLPTNIEQLFELIVTEIKSVRAGNITDEELQSIKDYELGNYQRSAQTASQLTSGYESYFALTDEVYDYHGVPERIQAITKERIVEAANLIFSGNQYGLAFDGATDKIDAAKLNSIIAQLY